MPVVTLNMKDRGIIERLRIEVEKDKVVNKKDVIRWLLDKYEKDEAFRKNVDECLRNKEIEKDRFTNIHIDVDTKKKLILIKAQTQKNEYEIIHCLLYALMSSIVSNI